MKGPCPKFNTGIQLQQRVTAHLLHHPRLLHAEHLRVLVPAAPSHGEGGGRRGGEGGEGREEGSTHTMLGAYLEAFRLSWEKRWLGEYCCCCCC
jgi:hypothetical protein